MFNKSNMLGMLKQAQQAKKQLKKVQKEIDRMVFKSPCPKIWGILYNSIDDFYSIFFLPS